MLEVRDDLAFYASPGSLTDPGDYAHLLDSLPVDVAELSAVVQGVMIHVFWAGAYGLTLSEDRTREVQLRGLAPKLRRLRELDPSPLAEARAVDRKLVGNCRDHSLLLTAFLRHKGIPARARCGFGTYFLPNHFEDHWVSEYWSVEENRWILVDAQLDALQRDALHIEFDPLDVPRDRFLTGGRAWQLCRSGDADPEKFGIQDMHGLWFVRGDLIRDAVSLAKVETLPWDWWGLVGAKDEELTRHDLAFLDRLAELTAGDVPAASQVVSIVETDSRVSVPADLRS